MKKAIIYVVVLVVAVIGIYYIINNNPSNGTSVNTSLVLNNSQQAPKTSTAVIPGSTSPGTVPLMQSSGILFSQYKYYKKAYEIFPTKNPDAQKALGAFTYTKKTLGTNVYQFALTNNAEGYKGKSVVVSGDQTVYFIEPALGDDSISEDSFTTDDILIAVDAQGYILK